MKHFSFLAVFFLYFLCVLCGQAGAESNIKPFNYIALYDVSWGGITVGKLVVRAYENKTSYAMDTLTKAKGIAWLFTRHSSTNHVSGIKKNDVYLPQTFETLFKLRGDTRHILLKFDQDGNLTKNEINTPKEDPKKRPPVPYALKQHALDGLSSFFVQRTKIHAGLRSGKADFTLRLYDGRHLTDIHYHVKGRQNVNWMNKQTNIIRFSLSSTPIGGYSKGDLEDFAKDPHQDITFYVSDDGRMIPLKIAVESHSGTVYANLKTYCPQFLTCIKQLD